VSIQTSPGRVRGHGLTVDRQEDITAGFVQYTGTCSCGRWTDRSLFRRLVTQAYLRHVADNVLDPEGKHEQLRATLRALRGPLAPRP
jgi:hypothetical protein